MADAASTLNINPGSATTNPGAGNPGAGNQGAAANAGGAAASPAAGTGAAPWHKFEGETLGYLQNKGLKLDDPAAFGGQIVKMYRDLEGMRGIPAERIMAWPKDEGDSEAWAAVHKRLGVPDKAEGYDLAGLKYADGSDVEAEYVDHVRGVAAQHKLTPTQARAVAADMLSFLEKQAGGSDAAEQERLTAQDNEWRQNWGANMERNLQVARNAAQALSQKLGPVMGQRLQQAVTSLEQAAGKGAVMDLFLHLGRTLGEDIFVGGGDGSGGSTPAMSREQAMARVKELQRDPVWSKAYMAGDAEKAREMRMLTSVIAGHAWPMQNTTTTARR